MLLVFLFLHLGCCSGGCGAGCCSGGCGGGCCSGGCGGGCCSTGCCGGCGDCGGCCGSCSASACSTLGTYTPALNVIEVTIPLVPEIADAPTPLEAHSVVGIAVNGVTFSSLPLALTFDNCLGHTDTDHSYHYHLPPKCLLNSLGVATPCDTDWWHQENTTDYWPSTSSPSPLVGWALDGFPIFGPYDSHGDLMSSDLLDVCNGKTDLDGGYRYYLTPDAPYTLGCFKGTPGSIDQELLTPHQKCQQPTEGAGSYYDTRSELALALSAGTDELVLLTCDFEVETRTMLDIGFPFYFYCAFNVLFWGMLLQISLFSIKIQESMINRDRLSDPIFINNVIFALFTGLRTIYFAADPENQYERLGGALNLLLNDLGATLMMLGFCLHAVAIESVRNLAEGNTHNPKLSKERKKFVIVSVVMCVLVMIFDMIIGSGALDNAQPLIDLCYSFSIIWAISVLVFFCYQHKSFSGLRMQQSTKSLMKNKILQTIIFQVTVGTAWIVVQLFRWWTTREVTAENTLSVLFVLRITEMLFTFMSLHNTGGITSVLTHATKSRAGQLNSKAGRASHASRVGPQPSIQE